MSGKLTKIPAFAVSNPTAVSTAETYGVKLSQNLRAVSVDGKALAQQVPAVRSVELATVAVVFCREQWDA